MCEIINFLDAKRNINKQKVFDEYISGNINQYLIDGYRHLDIARHKQRQINDCDYRIFHIENKMRELKEAKQECSRKAANSFINAVNKGCVQAKKALKDHFPETYKFLKAQNKDK